jgi:hypothetical protein
MDKIIGTHLVDDGDNTLAVSSIVNGMHDEIADGPYSVFKLQESDQLLIYNNYTNGLYKF